MNRQFLHSTGKRSHLRIGIACNNQLIPRYARQVLRDITESDFADIVCILESRETGQRKGKGLIKRLRGLIDGSKRRYLLYVGYQILTKPFCERSSDPLDLVPFADLIPNDITDADLTCHGDTTTPLPVNLDVILNLGNLQLNTACSRSARHGVWFFRLGEGRAQTNDPELIASVLADPASTARITLEMAGASNQTTILAEAFYSMMPTLSAHKNHFPPYWGSTHLVIEKLRDLHQSEKIGLINKKSPVSEKSEKNPHPTNRQILVHQIERLKKFARRLPNTLRQGSSYVHWDIALRHSLTPLLEQEENTALSQFHWLSSPPGHFWADPFLIEKDGVTWLFFEDFVLADGKGRIACGRISKGGELLDVRVVLEKPYHLSYPQVFQHDSEVFLVPESAQHHSVSLYRATDFPNRWEHESQLLDVGVVDATLAEHDGRWWMFASPMAVSGHAPMTYLWTATELASGWHLASSSAINSNVCHSRGAGSLHAHNGKLYRISQDGSMAYGSALWFNEITQWDIRGYREKPVRHIKGRCISGLTGIHSYNRSGYWEVIDGRFLRSIRHHQARRASSAAAPSLDSPLPPSTQS